MLKLLLLMWIFYTSALNVYAEQKENNSKAQLLSLISKAEEKYKIPKGLLAAIAKVESNVMSYAINVAGTAIKATSLDVAKSIVQEKINEGRTNIDIGVMQLNYRWHADKFSNIEEMLSPEKNIAYAAQLLSTLKQGKRDWQSAIRVYHSYNAVHNRKYFRKVTLCWLQG